MAGKGKWYPRRIYHFWEKLAFEKNLSTYEIECMFLRQCLTKYGEFTCEHSNIGFKDKKSYCKDCYTRVEKFEEARLFKGKILKEIEYRPLETFVDKQNREDEEAREADIEARIKAEVNAAQQRLLDAAKKEDISASAREEDTVQEK
jgi:hypothetical protein